MWYANGQILVLKKIRKGVLRTVIKFKSDGYGLGMTLLCCSQTHRCRSCDGTTQANQTPAREEHFTAFPLLTLCYLKFNLCCPFVHITIIKHEEFLIIGLCILLRVCQSIYEYIETSVNEHRHLLRSEVSIYVMKSSVFWDIVPLSHCWPFRRNM
jgi:hypothetical protein